MSFEARYQKLNAEQKLAVDTIEGPVMVVAGPGTGKTELLGLRVANILRESDTLPSGILCLTFTDLAAKNMRERLVGLIGAEAYKVAINTFHSFALDISHRFPDEFYEEIAMQSADEIVQIETLGKILERLPYSDPFQKKNPKGTFVYLNDIKSRIGQLKKAGLAPEEFKRILETNASSYQLIEEILVPIFEQRMSKKVRDLIPEALLAIKDLTLPAMSISHMSLLDYQKLLISSLGKAYEEAVEEDKTRSLTEWKENWFKKDPATKQSQLKDSYQLKRNLSLANVYGEYQEQLKAAGYIDFEDMIIDLIQAMITKPGLLAELQEKYQYVLVDEFQDTNEAQMRIIHLLTDNPVNEGLPNIMIVGDDDQSIFKFQGAELNNVVQFQARYPGTKFITLTKNYRSTAAIVDFAQRIITQGTDRLTTRIAEINKQLTAANPSIAAGTINTHTFDTAVHEYAYIVKEIQAVIASGTEASEIAIIARNHKQLEALTGQLQAAGIAVNYEKSSDVLAEPHILQLITLAQLVCSLAKDQLNYEKQLLSDVLSFPFWNLDRRTVWQLAATAQEQKTKENKGRWLDMMLASEDEQLKNIALWLLDTAARVSTEPLNNLLDHLIGAAEATTEFSSPFRRFYFNKEKYSQDPRSYLQFLTSLNTFVDKVRSFASRSDKPQLIDLVNCVEIHNKHRVAIPNTSTQVAGTQAISLLSAHKAKGLEFDTVFVVNCQKDIWSKKKGAGKIAFPKNLPITPASDTEDDYLRIFFVALTRAKRHLYVTSYTNKDNGKLALRLPFLDETKFQDFPHSINSEHKQMSEVEVAEAYAESSLNKNVIINPEEKLVLAPLLDKYVLSVTHLNNFLNVTKGGPHSFLEQNLLRFPQAKSANAAYGTAMHATMEFIYHQLKNSGSLAELSAAQSFYEERLETAQMTSLEFTKFLNRGKDELRTYLLTAANRFDSSHLIETNFSKQQVMVDDVHIAGNIDKIVPHEEDKTIEVYDFKTGKQASDWKRKDITLHSYKRQLIFYKLLIELSRDYSKYKVHTGYIEYLQPTERGELILLPYQISEADVERTKALIKVVDKKIRALDFPDVSGYEQTLAGVIQFEDDLIDGKI